MYIIIVLYNSFYKRREIYARSASFNISFLLGYSFSCFVNISIRYKRKGKEALSDKKKMSMPIELIMEQN
jgi:hypothetical protein